MARLLETNKEIDSFIEKVCCEAKHHANGVVDVIKPLSDEVRQQLDVPQKGTVEVYERKKKLVRTCWVTTPSQARYVFSYNYSSGKIELRDGSTRGKLRFEFDNTHINQVSDIILDL